MPTCAILQSSGTIDYYCDAARHLPCIVLAIYRYAVLHEERASNESDRIFDIIHSIKRSTLGADDRVLHTPIEHSKTMDNKYTREERDTSGGKECYVIQYYTIPLSAAAEISAIIHSSNRK